MTTKKKKTAREKRVLIASIITAAMIVTSSTFAWFTSEDDVTNRLTANADYNVSIVESFAPPVNWVPGQVVEKDVYAVNTGTIGAFVEEDVAGVLTITTVNEVPTETAAAPQITYVKLNDAERYVVEAGSYLALAPETSKEELGQKIVATDPAAEYAAGENDFIPDADGLYVFRRTIDVSAADQSEEFEYVGYYYMGGEYYKVKINSVTADDVVDYADDGVNTDGNLTSASYSFFEEKTETVVPSLSYDPALNRLVATYKNAALGENFKPVTSEDLQPLAADLDKAEHDLAAAAFALKQAGIENNATSAAIKAADALIARLEKEQTELNNEKNAKNARLEEVEAGITALNTAIETLQGEIASDEEDLYGKTGGSEEDYVNTEGATNKYNQFKEAEKKYNDEDPGFKAQYIVELQNATGVTDVSTLTYTQLLDVTFNNPDEFHEIHELYVDMVGAKEAYDKAKAEYDEKVGDLTVKQNRLGTEGTAAVGQEGDPNYVPATPATGLTKEKKDLTDRLAEITTRLGTLGTELADARTQKEKAPKYGDSTETGKKNLEDAEKAYKEAVTAYNNAKIAFNNANNMLGFNNEFNIYINLSDAVSTEGGIAEQWQIVPAKVQNDVAKFYYTSILEGGQTSSKLVDSVELDSNVTQDMYKSFDFDLNISLKSAQMTYASDNKTILATAAKDELGLEPEILEPTNIKTALNWAASETNPTQYVYTPVTGADWDDAITYHTNPKQTGWYEKNGDDYVLTNDTEIDTEKTYYTRSETQSEGGEGGESGQGQQQTTTYSVVSDDAKQAAIDNHQSPAGLGWYEMDGENYVPSVDLSVQMAKTYYTQDQP